MKRESHKNSCKTEIRNRDKGGCEDVRTERGVGVRRRGGNGHRENGRSG